MLKILHVLVHVLIAATYAAVGFGLDKHLAAFVLAGSYGVVAIFASIVH